MAAATLLPFFLAALPASAQDPPAVEWDLAPGRDSGVVASFEGSPLLRLAIYRRGSPVPVDLLPRGAGRWLLAAHRSFVEVVAVAGRLRLEPETRSARGLEARLTFLHGPDAFPACLEDPGDGILQLRLGRAPGRARRSMFLPLRDLALHVPADLDLSAWQAGGRARLRLPLSEPAWAEAEPRALQHRRGLAFYAPMARDRFPTAPAGWCSWYYYYRDVTPAAVRANAAWLARELAPFGADLVQIDDGWQGENGTGYGDVRDWTRLSPRFSEGMASLAADIRALGLRAGLWLAPHGQSNPDLFREHPQWFLRDARGEAVGASWEGNYLLDPTHPGALAYLRGLFTRMHRDWGFDYFKIDGQPIVLDLYRRLHDRFQDADADPVDAWRRTLAVMRESIGPESYLLGCWGQPREGIGILDGCRTGGDIVATWQGMRAALDATRSGLWLNNLLWWSDPDVLCVRPPLTLEEARTWATLFGLSGQALLLSDDMPALGRERVALLRRILPTRDLRPLDLHPLAREPWLLDVRLAPGAGFPGGDLLALFTWGDAEALHEVDFAALGWEDPQAPRLVLDAWAGRSLGTVRGGLALSVPGHGVRVLRILRVPGRTPALIAQDRHLLPGLEEWHVAGDSPEGHVRWHRYRGVVSPPGQPRRLFFYVGRHRVAGVREGAAALEWRQEGTVCRVTLPPAANTGRRIALGLEGGAVPPPAEERPVLSLDQQGRPVLSWRQPPGAPPLQILRSGRRVAVSDAGRWVDPAAPPGRRLYYAAEPLRAAVAPGWSVRLEVETPPARTTRLQDLPFTVHEQGWGSLGRGASVEGNPLRIGGRAFPHGLGVHAPSRTVVRLWGAYARFTALAGVDDEVGAHGSVLFRVLVDGVERFASPLLRGGDPPVAVDVDLRGAESLELRTEPGPDDMNWDHADWAEAMLLAAVPPPVDQRKNQ